MHRSFSRGSRQEYRYPGIQSLVDDNNTTTTDFIVDTDRQLTEMRALWLLLLVFHSLLAAAESFSSASYRVGPVAFILPTRANGGFTTMNPNSQQETPPLWRTPVSSSSRIAPPLSMSLVPLSVDELERIISSSGKPTGEQYATYWGRTAKERYGRAMEATAVTLLGTSFSYCLSFVLGGFVATIIGGIFAFWAVFAPEFKAYQRNWEFLGGRPLVDDDRQTQNNNSQQQLNGLYGALFLGHIADVCVVENSSDTVHEEYDLTDFADYTMETDALDRYTGQPYLLRIQCADRQAGRTLQIHARLSEDYLSLRKGMPIATLMLCTNPQFTKLAALTDILALPLLNDKNGNNNENRCCWIGDYPYLNRPEVEAWLAEDDDLWEAIQDEALLFVKDSDGNDGDSGNEAGWRRASTTTQRQQQYQQRKEERTTNEPQHESFRDSNTSNDENLVLARRRRRQRQS